MGKWLAKYKSSMFETLGGPTDRTATGQKEKRQYDPRSDLREDNKLWEAVLRTACRYFSDKPEVYGTLHGFRCCGARLVLLEQKKTLQLEPRIGKEYGWQNFSEYSEDRKVYLLPLAREVLQVFREVAKTFPASDKEGVEKEWQLDREEADKIESLFRKES